MLKRWHRTLAGLGLLVGVLHEVVLTVLDFAPREHIEAVLPDLQLLPPLLISVGDSVSVSDDCRLQIV